MHFLRRMVFKYVLSVCVLSVVVKIIDAHDKLKVLVLYESLCTDSIRFIGQQLGPNFEALKPYIDVTLVPFGKSYSTENGAQFFCQHGPKECFVNRQHSCVLQQTFDQSTQIKFLVCQTQGTPSDICANLVGLTSNIDLCMMTALGTQLQLEAENITRQYAPKFVPTIIYNGAFNQQLQDNSISNFYGTVCYLLQKGGNISFHDNICQ